ncbi:MAG TPA: diadenylate cyclase CdaA [Symbiobacteriaceae bacterium]|nr:diadenylate cyclase CdaA [Symbiobacteriaceae bacterium]
MADRFVEFGLINQWDYFRTVLDVSIVAYIVYKLFSFIRGTRAVPLINGIFILAIGWFVAFYLQLYTIQWILRNAAVAASVAIPIIFQPELRRALEHLGRGKLLPMAARQREDLKGEELRRLIDQLVRAAEILGRTKTGALIVIERETGLGEYIDSGIMLDAVVTWELLTNIFVEKTPLHDGAVIIRATRAAAAACWLPLAEASVLSHDLGTRHRAGVGVTEQSDAVTVIVSEETGTISVAQGGKLIRHLDEKTLREMLNTLLDANKPSGGGGGRGFWNWGAAS